MGHVRVGQPLMSIPDDFGFREEELTEIVIPNDLRSAKQPEERILRECSGCGYDADTVFAIKLALEEAMTNAVKHGNRNDAAKHVTVRYRVTPGRVVIMIRDEGPGFSLNQVPDPTSDENLERPNGRGIMLIHSYMNKVRFNKTGNEVWMLKENRPSARGPCHD
jgi:serine/threonine-protein kinase RsbW